MIDIKFNCHDLAGKNAEIFAMHRKMHCLSGMSADIFDDQQPQIKNYVELQKEFTEAKIKNDELTARVLTAHDALDQIIDQYYAAESKVSQASEELPIDLLRFYIKQKSR